MDRVREAAIRQRHSRTAIPLIDAIVASDRTRQGDLDGAIELSRAVVKEESNGGGVMWTSMATDTLVEALLNRGARGDLDEAQAAIDRLAADPTDPGYVVNDIWLLRMRSLMAQARGEDATYRDYRDRYRKMAADLGFEGHMAMAQAMT
jgi:adenylate cyclase